MSRTRRDFARLALGAIPAVSALQGAPELPSVFNGVRLAIGSYSFREFTLDDIIAGLQAVPLGTLELESRFVEPGMMTAGRGGLSPAQREALRHWRLGASTRDLSVLKKRFDDAGIHIYAYNIPVDASFTDAEIERLFPMAQALGAEVINVVTTLPMVERLAAPAAKYKMRTGFHPTIGPRNKDSIGTGDSWRRIIALSPYFGVCPDLGQRALWGPDPLAFLREMGGRLTALHTHDSVPFGQGQAPVREILRMIRNEKMQFVPVIERVYPLRAGMDQLTELRNLIEYCKNALA
jgi:sugar phosphate isomerase/epimerase